MKILRKLTRAGWTTKPAADEPENRLTAEEVDRNFLEQEDELLDHTNATNGVHGIDEYIAQLMGGVTQALDLASQAYREVPSNLALEQLIQHVSALQDLAGQSAKAVSGGDVLLRGGTATEPSVSPVSDRDTGIYFPAVDAIAIAVAGLEALRVDPSGRLGIGTDTPSAKLDIEDDRLRLRQSRTPSSATDTGSRGEISWDADYFYICVAANTWKRAALSSW